MSERYTIPSLEKKLQSEGIGRASIIGAFHEKDGKYTISEAKKIISKWEKGEVK